MKLDDKTNEVWDRAQDCDCDSQDCETNHKLCGICGEKMIYGAHESNQPGSRYSWNTDHIIPWSRGGSDRVDNLQAVHVGCNRKKGNR